MALKRPTKEITLTEITVVDDATFDGTTLTVDSENNRVGVGTLTPSAQLDVQDTTTSSANTGGKLRLSANDSSPMGDSHRLGVLEFTGAEDSSNTQVVGARIEALTDAAWTNAENGCALYFYTTDGNASESNVLKIDSNKKSTFNGVLDITDATDSSDDSGDTGALRCEGGASIAKKLYVGTDLTVSGGDITFGNGQDAAMGITATAHNAAGKPLIITAGAPTAGTTDDIGGGALTFKGGASKGTAHGGDITFQVTKGAGSSADTINSYTTLMTMDASGKETVFNKDAIFDGTSKCQFYDSGLYIYSSANGVLDIVADTTVQITGATKLVSGALNFGEGQNAGIEIVDTAHNVAGKDLTLRACKPTAGTTNNIAGGSLILEGGQGKGTGNGGDIEFKVAKAAGGSASSLNSLSTVMKIKQDKSVDIQGQIVVGADDSGHDVKFYGATASAYMLWDEDEDDLILGGAAGLIVPVGQLTLGSVALANCTLNTVTAAAAVTINATNDNGRTYIIKELAAHQTFTLPAPTAHFKVSFVTVMNNVTYDIIVKTAAAGHRIGAGLFTREDREDDAEHGWDDDPQSYVGITNLTYTGSGHASEENKNQVTLDNALAGTKFEFYSDGVVWYCTGEIVMSEGTGSTGTITFALWS